MLKKLKKKNKNKKLVRQRHQLLADDNNGHKLSVTIINKIRFHNNLNGCEIATNNFGRQVSDTYLYVHK